MKEKKTHINFVKVEDLKLKKGWSVGVDRKPKSRKLAEIMADLFKEK